MGKSQTDLCPFRWTAREGGSEWTGQFHQSLETKKVGAQVILRLALKNQRESILTAHCQNEIEKYSGSTQYGNIRNIAKYPTKCKV